MIRSVTTDNRSAVARAASRRSYQPGLRGELAVASLSRKGLLWGVMTSGVWNDLKHGPVPPDSGCPTLPGGTTDHDGPAFKSPVSSWGWQNLHSKDVWEILV